jgi:hypothetical protein
VAARAIVAQRVFFTAGEWRLEYFLPFKISLSSLVPTIVVVVAQSKRSQNGWEHHFAVAAQTIVEQHVCFTSNNWEYE